MARCDAVVIGSGIGGSVAAAVLAAEGLSVLVLEKNTKIGGVCASYEKRGFTVDIGTHMFSRGNRGPLGRIARRVGARAIPFAQTRDLALVRGFGRELRLPRDVRRWPLFALSAARALELSPREMAQAARFFSQVLLFDEARLPELDRVTMWEFVTRYTEQPRLIGLLGFLLGLYFVLPLAEVSAGEGVFCFRRMILDRSLAYPRGGAVAVPRTFLDRARSMGAILRTRAEVARIHVEGGAVRAVECADGTSYETRVVVSTTSLRDLTERLVDARQLPEAYLARVRSIRSSMIAVQAKLALSRPLLDAGALVGVHGDAALLQRFELGDFDRLYSEVCAGRVAPLTPIYAPVPTNFDPTLAPRGMQLVTACAVAPTTDIDAEHPPEAWIDNMMGTLRAMIPGLDDALLWVDTMTTHAVERWSGKLFAPAISTGQTPDQVGNRRPPVHTPIRGLYVAGCGAGARGIGTELAAASGEEAADRVVTDRVNGLLD